MTGSGHTMRALCAKHLMEKVTCIILGVGAALRPGPLTGGKYRCHSLFCILNLVQPKQQQQRMVWAFAKAEWISTITKQAGCLGSGWHLVSEGCGHWEASSWQWFLCSRKAYFLVGNWRVGMHRFPGSEPLIKYRT